MARGRGWETTMPRDVPPGSTGDRDATRAAVYVIESEEYVNSAPPLPTSLFDDPVKLRRAMAQTGRSLRADG